MSRPQVTVRRVGRRPTAIRNSAHPPGTTRSFRPPERGRPTAEWKDPPTSPESAGVLAGLLLRETLRLRALFGALCSG